MVFKLVLINFFLVTFIFAKEKNILLIHSFSKGTSWADGISTAIDLVFSKYPNFNISTEYIGIDKYNSKKYLDLKRDSFIEKFSKSNYDIVIVADHFAIDFVMNYRNEMFKDTPMIFCGLENDIEKYKKKYNNKNINLVLENTKITKTISLMEIFFPNLDVLYIINKNTIVNLEENKAILNYQYKFKIIKETEINFNKILEEIKNYQKNRLF